MKQVLTVMMLALGLAGGAFGQGTTPPFDATRMDSLKTKPEEKAVSFGGITKSIGGPRISYDQTKSIKIVPKKDGTIVEQPYVPIPILFKVNTTDLLDPASQENVRLVKQKLQEILAEQTSAVFVIEGHASAEGSDEDNLDLSRRRAKKIEILLGLASGSVSSTGYGEEFAHFPENAPEEDRQQDRQVRVVRVQ